MSHQGNKRDIEVTGTIMKIAVFVSGNGSNLQALIDAREKDGLAGGEITLVVSDHADAYAVKRARQAGIPVFVHEAAGSSSREEYDTAISRKLKESGIELIVLAGFMRILGDGLVEEYKWRMMNIHPSLLPSFKGTHGIRDAFEYGVKVTGVTVHFVEKELDAGPVILQTPVMIGEDDTLETLEKKIHEEEHRLYPRAVQLFIDGKLDVRGRKVRIRE